jgi:hypothetical protein
MDVCWWERSSNWLRVFKFGIVVHHESLATEAVEPRAEKCSSSSAADCSYVTHIDTRYNRFESTVAETLHRMVDVAGATSSHHAEQLEGAAR